MAEEKTEGKETGKYLTRKYLVSNLQNFWKSIKKYITDQKFVDQSYVSGAINNAVDIKVEEAIDGKVDKVEGMGLSANDFTDVLKDKLDQLPDSAATHSDMGFMSGDDKQQLDRLAAAITEVDNELKSNSENPVQNKVITEALNSKADAGTLDPSQVFTQDLRLVKSAAGEIVFEPMRSDIKHFKLHTEKGEIIEKFYISGTSDSSKTEVFNTFENFDRDIRIPNPDGTTVTPNAVYKFYVECLEFSDSGKYKPFILRVQRDGDNPITLILNVFKS